jgi:hypothetical protein
MIPATPALFSPAIHKIGLSTVPVERIQSGFEGKSAFIAERDEEKT